MSRPVLRPPDNGDPGGAGGKVLREGRRERRGERKRQEKGAGGQGTGGRIETVRRKGKE